MIRHYHVEIDQHGTQRWYAKRRWWNLKKRLHRINGPAIEYLNGHKRWFLNGREYDEAGWRRRVSRNKSDIIEVDGKLYKLVV